jgi:MAF protein
MSKHLADGRQLILASTSPYRRELLSRLRLDFLCEAPDVEESRQSGEWPLDTARRLARAKAKAVADGRTGSLVIGADQLAELDGKALGKPGSEEMAKAQLAQISGRTVLFHTALCLLDSDSGREQVDSVPYTVVLRPLSTATIERYVALERPLDCAGSFKSEGLGVSLFARQSGDDPTALMGLPLIRLVSMLAKEGLELP